MDSLDMLTIYESPSDYPGRFVVRRFQITAGGMRPDQFPLAVVATLAEAREAVQRSHPTAVRLSRVEGDDPIIVETWT